MSDLENKLAFKSYLDALAYPGDFGAAARAIFAPDAVINVCHPFNEMKGVEAYLERFLEPLLASFEGLFRREYILMGGAFGGSDWVTSTGYYAGHFGRDWLGIKATGTLAYLRVGEFHRFEGGKIVESYIFLDIPELMIAAGVWPITDFPGKDRGYTGLLMGPASNDGMQLVETDPARSQSSADLVTNMLKGLATKDEAWRPFWHENMVWYGPAAFGSFVGIENFAGFQVPFEQAFTHWSGGANGNGVTEHFTRFGDGDYICTGGWPSLMAVRSKTFLGQPSDGSTLLMRVCDWWRRDGDLLVENWVFVDIPDALLQMGYDLFEGTEYAA